ncbi:hypothetical protein [Nocardia nova]
MEQFALDSGAMAHYTAAAADIAAKLGDAARSVHAAADIERLTADLGTVGAEFIAAFIAALGGHAEVLDSAAGLVGGYGDALAAHTATAAELDADAAARIGRTTEGLA